MAIAATKPSKSRTVKTAPTVFLLGPALAFLIVCTQVPFVMTIFYSFRRFNLLNPDNQGWIGFGNFISYVGSKIRD